MAIKISDITGQATIIADGAWGTELAKLGDLAGSPAEVWNLQHPERVEQVAKSYVAAGSQIILTNSFSGNRFQLKKHGLEENLKEINQLAVEISRRAAAGRALVFASLGPTGKLLAMEEVTEDEIAAAYTEQADALKAAGPDAVVVETMSDAQELKLAVRAAKKAGFFCVASMSFDTGPEKTHTMMGVSAEAAVAAAEEAGADIIGANCGTGINDFVNICRAFKRLTRKPLWIKGNAGLPEAGTNGRPVYRMGPAEFARHGREISKLGANIIGGCCGTTPEHIKALAQLLRG